MTVTVFTNPSNPQCEATEQELAKLGVRYDTVDLTKNPSTFEQIKNAGFKPHSPAQPARYMRPAVDGSSVMVWNRLAMKSSSKYVAKNCETGEFCAIPAIREYQASSAISVITPSMKISAKHTAVNV